MVGASSWQPTSISTALSETGRTVMPMPYRSDVESSVPLGRSVSLSSSGELSRDDPNWTPEQLARIAEKTAKAHAQLDYFDRFKNIKE